MQLTSEDAARIAVESLRKPEPKIFESKRQALIASVGDVRPLWTCHYDAGAIGELRLYGLANTELQFRREAADFVLREVRKVTSDECHRLMASELEDSLAKSEL